MSDAGTGPAAGSTTPAPVAPAAPAAPPTEAELLRGLEDMLAAEEQPRRRREPKQQDPTPAQDAAPEARPEPEPEQEEEPTTGETESEDEGAEPEEPSEEASPAIEPPRSWNAADREAWAEATPRVQEVFARRQNEIDRAYQQKSQEFAEQSRSSANERLRERDEYAANLQKLLYVAAPDVGRFQQIDWTRLARENPDQWAALTEERNHARDRIATLQGELNRVQAQSQQERAQLEAQYKQQQLELLAQRLPVIADREKGPKLANELNQWLLTQGFTNEEIGQVYDHRAILLAEKAMRADKAAAARRTVVPDRARPPTVQQPGVKSSSRPTAAQRRDQKLAAMKQSGINQGRTHDKDAIAYLLEMVQ